MSYVQASQDLGVHVSQLRDWVKKFAADAEHAFPGHGQMKPERHAWRRRSGRSQRSWRGGAPLGIVYATDAKVEPRVKVIGIFPADSHPAIVYPVAATVTAKPEAYSYLSYLRSAAAKTVFEHYGFVFLIPPAS